MIVTGCRRVCNGVVDVFIMRLQTSMSWDCRSICNGVSKCFQGAVDMFAMEL